MTKETKARGAAQFAKYALAALLVIASNGSARAEEQAAAATKPAAKREQVHGGVSGGTADHSKFEILKKDFASGPEVTAACLTCHTEASKQVMSSIHWTWKHVSKSTEQPLGKSRVMNSFCGNVAANEPRCTSCHVGYGWTRMADGPPQSESSVDCLVCHDRSGSYTKQDNKAGHPPMTPVDPKAKTITGAKAVAADLTKAAQSIGLPGRETCGQCHFYGGGGDNVKHGDLSSALVSPSKSVDVHMASDGPNFACSKCHQSRHHKWPGSRYDITAKDEGGKGRPGERRAVATCESCHGSAPHKAASVAGVKLNDHVDRIACQTCHIPSFARGGVATKTKWDLSAAGKLVDGKPIHEDNYTQGNGKKLHTYLSTKGRFEWGENVKPHYGWFDGQMHFTLRDMKIDPSKTVEINSFAGKPEAGARIWPFKRMEGQQAYDKQLKNLVHNQVYGPETDTAFWNNFDYAKSIKAAMDYIGQPYSGEFGFVDTYMYWPITHMVAPKGDALACSECHAKDGRLAHIAGAYMPGTDPFGTTDRIGLALVLAALGGVLIHALVRLVAGRKGDHHG